MAAKDGGDGVAKKIRMSGRPRKSAGLMAGFGEVGKTRGTSLRRKRTRFRSSAIRPWRSGLVASGWASARSDSLIFGWESKRVATSVRRRARRRSAG